MFTVNDRIGKITGSAEFKGYEFMTGKFSGIGGVFSGMMKVNTMAKVVGWNPQSMVDGWNYLSNRAKQGKVFYDIYSKEEMASDPSKKSTGLAAFPLEKKAKFCIVCAGGGYASVCSMVEAYPIIKALNEMGYAAFSLQYRVGKDAKAPHPMEDLARAVSFILKNTAKFHVDAEDYSVMGFSAGGHLAASFGTDSLGYSHYGLPKPATLVLSYPVITMGEKTHAGSRNALIGKNADEKLIDLYSIDKQISNSYPASFVWQFDNDSMVPVDNSQMIVKNLRENGIPVEYVTYPGKLHGAGLGIGTACEGWLEEAVCFWEKQCEPKR